MFGRGQAEDSRDGDGRHLSRSAKARPPHIVVHDYSGHPGQAELSRSLAGHGYQVTHQHCPSYATGKGSLEHEAGDPATLRFEACPMHAAFKRYSFVTRVRQEVAYGRKASRLISRHEPQAVVLSNVPLIADAVIARHLTSRKIPMVFWLQDIYSEAIGACARRRLGALGRPIAWVADRVERHIARKSAGIVAISPTFLDRLRDWNVADKAIVVPNWAPIGDLPVRPRANPWSERMGLCDRPVVLYSGTLGLKHDPSLLALMADELRVSHPDARVVVISEGKGRDWLEEWKRDQRADNLVLLDFQPYDALPDVLASADILVALLEPDASRFSVPSKILTYLCSCRAVLGVMPPTNSVAEILLANHAGHVVDPSERADIAPRVVELLNDDELRLVMGKAGRRYAETEFSADRAADRFEEILAARLAVPIPSLPEANVIALRPPAPLTPSSARHASTTQRRHRRDVRSTAVAVGAAAAAVLIAVGLGSSSGPKRAHGDGVASAATSPLPSPTASGSTPTVPGAAVDQANDQLPDTSSLATTLAADVAGIPGTPAAAVAPAAVADVGSGGSGAAVSSGAGGTAGTDPGAVPGTQASVATTGPTATTGTPGTTPGTPGTTPNTVGSVVQVADQAVAGAGAAVSTTSGEVGTAVPQADPISSVVGSLVSPPLSGQPAVVGMESGRDGGGQSS